LGGDTLGDVNAARRADVEIVLRGSKRIIIMNRDWNSFTYTDNEEDSADDITLKTEDRDGNWLRNWLSGYIEDTAEAGAVISTPEIAAGQSGRVSGSDAVSDSHKVYKITSPQGLNVRKGAGTKYKILGKLAYGDYIEVKSISGGWANITYMGKSAYVKSDNLRLAGASSSSGSSGLSSSAAGASNAVNSGLQSGTLSKGVKISAAIVLKNDNGDGKDSVLDCGLFELDNIDLSGPPSLLTLKATSLSYSSTMRQTIKSKSWENVTLKQIARQIAEANGMGVMYEAADNPKYSRVEQYRASDISFLQKLCHDAGCSLKAANNIIIIFDQAEYEAKNAVKTIVFGKSGYIKYKLSTGENDIYTSCRVYYTDSGGVTISATEYAENYREGEDNGQCLEVRQKVSSVAEAQTLAHKLLRLHNKLETTAVFTFPGDTSLVAGCAVQLSGFGFWDGKYIIKQARHSVSKSGYTTDITLRKSLIANVASAAAPSGDTDAELYDLAMQVIRGEWGNGEERRERLTKAGHDYAAVQAKVNEILYG